MKTQEHTVVGNLDLKKIYNKNFLVSPNRTIRIWTPFNYNKNSLHKYKTIYMFDGANLFDKATAFIDEWEIDETILTCLKENKIRPSIVIGLDSSKDRLSELLPRFSNKAIANLAYKGEETLDFLISKVMPYINKHYNVSTNRNDITLAGSSMGGLMALAGGIDYPEVFGNILSFSPAFPLYKYGLNEEPPCHFGTNNDEAFKYVIKKYLDPNLINKFKIFISAGGQGIEKEYTKYPLKFTKKLLKNNWNSKNILCKVDKNYSHNEEQWSMFFYYAYKFINQE